MIVRCIYCGDEWKKPAPNTQNSLISHGICGFCSPLADAHIDGYLKNYPIEAVKSLARKLRKERGMKHGTDARFH